ncbi:MAG: transcriptional repressor [Bacteroidetes bacterium]|nr:transcriptional repressor [Bacteroidota bacterium]MBT3424352.1 transcriptional repressor [Bacteroidota bacterium]MBT4337106.1 transcriptional repressor [Bacteroidota bacterium]MBT6838111.1 transcriptional repressor [Bacteroidota bacterium]MBT7826869.1 transcriptional repressor [Bacteroidota bacterium]
MKKPRKDLFDEVKGIFTNYLKAQDYRKTQGRYDILYEIYSIDEHFEVETLYLTLKNKNYHISRATIYNTIDLLLDCGLIVKHSFGTKAGSYENAYGSKQHDHLINIENKSVIEFRDERLQEIVKTIGNEYDYEITHYSFTLYGKPKEK